MKILSVTELDTYRRCPLRYAYRYRRRLPLTPRSAGKSEVVAVDPSLLGTLVHRTLEEYFDAKRAGEAWPVTRTEQKFVSLCKGFGLADERVSATYLPEGRKALAGLAKSGYDRPGDAVVEVELVLYGRVEGAMITGTLDRVDRITGGGLEIVDYKVDRRVEPQGHRFTLSLYHDLYARARGESAARLTLVYLRHGRAERVEYDGAAAEEAARAVGGIGRGEFPARPGAQCARCGYRPICARTGILERGLTPA